MAREKLATLADGEYLAKCRQPTALSAAMNGHAGKATGEPIL